MVSGRNMHINAYTRITDYEIQDRDVYVGKSIVKPKEHKNSHTHTSDQKKTREKKS